MIRVRLHGRGGQGMKTASRILGSAFFLEGFEVQDAPRYGAERRGAPVFAYVRASRAPIHERGVITKPSLVVVADETLLSVPAAGVLQGVGERTVLVIHGLTPVETWRARLNLRGPVHVLRGEAQDPGEHVAAACAGAAARLVGVISWPSLARAIGDELAFLDPQAIEQNCTAARRAFDLLGGSARTVAEEEEAPGSYAPPAWLEIPFDEARLSAPAIHAAATSVEVRTGLWRTMRPVVDEARCHRCWWICSTLCPDSAIAVGESGSPRIDYDHCKGCLVCVAVCPHHAIEAVPERAAGAPEAAT